MQEQIEKQLKLYRLLQEIDKEYSRIQSVDAIKEEKSSVNDKKRFQKNIMKKIFERKQNAKHQIQKLESKLLLGYAQNSKDKKCIRDILKRMELQYAGELISENITNPQGHKFGDYYDESCYHTLLNYCIMSALSEEGGSLPEDNALKLTVLFGNARKALNYINQNLKQGISFNDSCAFDLPDVYACDFRQWRKFALKYMSDQGFKKILKNAMEIECEIKHNSLKQTGKIPLSKISDKKKEIEAKNRLFKKLDRKAEHRTYIENSQREELMDDLFQLREALYHVSAGIRLKDADLLILKSYFEQYLKRESPVYEYFLQNRLKPRDFNRFIELERKDDDDLIPNITIAGEAIGYPGFYLEKIQVLDEMQAARAACLGKLTHCCQSLSGEIGEPCVIHGLTSPYGGFYVLCKGDVNNRSILDRVIAQCWSWRSKRGAIVFDSVEVNDAVHYGGKSKKMVLDFFRQLAKVLVLNGHTHKVACGTMSGISDELGLSLKKSVIEEFIDYGDQHCDSRLEQHVIADINALFYWYDMDSDFKEKTELLLKQEIQKGKKIINSTFMSDALCWAVSGQRNNLIKKINEISSKSDFPDTYEIISNSIRYIQGDMHGNSEDFLRAIRDDKLLLFVTDTEGNTPLISAIKNNEIDCAIKMINYGSAPDAKDRHGNTVLGLSCRHGDFQLINKVISAGADVNKQGKDHQTPLHIACETGNLELVDYLIARGAKISIDTLGLACAHENLALVDKLIDKGARINVGGYGGIENPLYISSKKGNIALVDKLIERGAEIDYRDSRGKSALHIACDKEHEELVERLLYKGARINIKDRMGITPLHIACAKGNISLLTKLLDNNACVNVETFYNVTPLHIACEAQNFKTAKMLIEKGANINVQDDLGKTPLHDALMAKDKKIATMLVKNGAKLDIPDFSGKTPEKSAEYFISLSFSQKLKKLQNPEIKENALSTNNGVLMFFQHNKNINTNTIKHETPITTHKSKDSVESSKHLRR